MNFTKLKKASESEFNKFLIERLDLTQYQKSKLRDDGGWPFYRSYFYVFQPRKENGSKNPIIRLTLLVYPLFWLLLLIIATLKWFITGDRYFKYNGPVLTFLHAWQRALNL